MQFLEYRNRRSGNTLLTSVIFLFVLAGTLRLCFNKTIYENKLTSIFIQETQGYYIMENMMALARDYVYQLTQNPREPNIFFGVDAFKRKTTGTNKLFDFNTTFVKNQIVPDGFPLSIVDNGWDIKGGPIFWQDKGSDDGHTHKVIRHLSEVIMLGSLRLNSAFIPDWTMYMAQTIEIERNPLTDFHLYSEGELALTTNLSSDLTFAGNVQINGNARLIGNTGATSGSMFLKNKLHIAGHALYVDQTGKKSITIPSKYGMLDNSSFYSGLRLPGSSNTSFYVNKNGTNTRLNCFSNDRDDFAIHAYQNFSPLFLTRARVYRPCGFDPIADGGYWTPDENVSNVPESRILDYTLGFHMLSRERCTIYNQAKIKNAGKNIRGLSDQQINEKARLVSSQQPMNFPGIECRILLKPKSSVNSAKLDVPNNFPYVTYSTTAFPASKDNVYLNRFLSLRTANFTILQENDCGINLWEEKANYSYGIDNSTTVSIPADGSFGYHQSIYNNKLVLSSLKSTSLASSIPAANQFIFYKTAYPLTSYDDTRYPPHKLIDCGDHWEEDTSARTRVVDDARYNFIYDRNRGKWVQIVDIDVGKMLALFESTDNWKNIWARAQRTIKINAYWAGSTNNANRNYKIDGKDIRENYATNHKNFMNTYGNGSYVYNRGSEPPVIDIGIRLTNARRFYYNGQGEGNAHNYGLTIICPYPLYIQGEFNAWMINYNTTIIADSITLLSDKFGDWSSGMDFNNSFFRSKSKNSSNQTITTLSAPPSIYANIITGRTHPNYWLKENKNDFNPDLGIHNIFRTLENFSGPITFRGSLLLPYYCLEQWEPPMNICNYNANNRNLLPADITIQETLNMHGTECTPTYLKVNRGRKTMMLGKTAYDALVAIYNKDSTATSYTFKTYHNTDLPNYLKYEADQ